MTVKADAAPLHTDDLVYLRRAEDAKKRGKRVKVHFRLDDSTPETWIVPVGKVTDKGIWTPGSFFIAYRRMEALREEEMEMLP